MWVIDCYMCPEKHQTFTRAPLERQGWKVSSFITCPQCRTRAVSCREPPGIQDRHDMVTLEWFIPANEDQYRHALGEASLELPTIGHARRLFESLVIFKKMMYRPCQKK